MVREQAPLQISPKYEKAHVAERDNGAMAFIALFHSVFGLRSMEKGAADRLRAAGHEVVTPDLYEGQVGETIEEGFALKDEIGWTTLERRAHDALRDLPGNTVLVGVSMGASIVDGLLPHRPGTAGVLLLHGIAQIPATARAGLPVQTHVADPDPFAPPAYVAAWRKAATEAGAVAEVFTYPGIGHFYTDAELPDYDEQAATLTWQRALTFLGSS
jgi:dienelactone hydrolase